MLTTIAATTVAALSTPQGPEVDHALRTVLATMVPTASRCSST